MKERREEIQKTNYRPIKQMPKPSKLIKATMKKNWWGLHKHGNRKELTLLW